MIASLMLALTIAHGPWTHVPGPHSKESIELKTRLDVRVPNYTLSANNFVQALVKVAGEYKIPMGIEWVQTRAAMQPVHLSRTGQTVQQIVAGIAKTQPGYEIEIKDAILLIHPRNLVPNREDFLTLRVAKFEVNDQVAEAASKHLAALIRPRVVPPKKLPGGSVQGGTAGSLLVEVGDPDISISLENTSVEDILSVISLASPFKVWVVTFSGNPDLTSGGFRRTVLRRDGKVVPDQWQPVWELLRWGRSE